MDTYEAVYKALLNHPVPPEGVLLPRDVVSRLLAPNHVADDTYDRLISELARPGLRC
jgi:hypothetical protein